MGASGQNLSPALVRDGVSVVEVGHTALSVWSAAASAERWAWWIQQLENMARRHPEGIYVLDVIQATASPPDAALRSRMKADLDRLSPKVQKLVVLPTGDGLWMNVVRAIVRGMLMLNKMTRRYTVVSTSEEALNELRIAGGPSRSELETGLRKAYDAVGLSGHQVTAA